MSEVREVSEFLDKLECFDTGSFHSEGDLYLYNKNDKKFILKRLYNDCDDLFKNKVDTVNKLISNKDKILIDELVIPYEFINVANDKVGFTIPYVDGAVLSHVLNSKEVSVRDKINYLKQIGVVLDKMKNVRDKGKLTDFYINDLHESNIMIDKDNNIRIIDMDSCKIDGNMAFPALYLGPFGIISGVSKYKKLDSSSCICGGIYEVNMDTDLYCYITIILNYISNCKIRSLDCLNKYLSYLRNIGISYELLDILALIGTNYENKNPYEYLDCLTSYVDNGKTLLRK